MREDGGGKRGSGWGNKVGWFLRGEGFLWVGWGSWAGLGELVAFRAGDDLWGLFCICFYEPCAFT